MQTIPALLAVAVTLLLTACYPPSTVQPVGKFTRDPNVSGLWLSVPTEKGTKASYYHFLPQEDGSVTVVIVDAKPGKPGGEWSLGTLTTSVIGPNTFMNARMIETNGKPAGEWSLATLTTSVIGPNTFMNARMIESNGKPETEGPHHTFPLLYRLDGQGRMHAYLMDEKATKAFIKAGKIEGTVGEGDDGDAVVTADQATLDKFLSTKEGVALFSREFLVLTKMT